MIIFGFPHEWYTDNVAKHGLPATFKLVQASHRSKGKALKPRSFASAMLNLRKAGNLPAGMLVDVVACTGSSAIDGA